MIPRTMNDGYWTRTESQLGCRPSNTSKMKAVLCFVSLFAMTYCFNVERQSGCPLFCPMNYAPLCGSDGKTYSNECELHVNNCLHKVNVVKVHQGSCDGVELLQPLPEISVSR
ncbi:serine protease inhibitor Kazal-type 1-like [Crassostrea virginica]